MKSKILTHEEYENTQNVLSDFQISLENIEHIVDQLKKVQVEYLNIENVSQAIELCRIPLLDKEGEEVTVVLQINPLQDFLDKDILQSMKKYHNIDQLNINIRKVKPGTNHVYEYCNKREEIYTSITQHYPKLIYNIMDAYFSIYSSLLTWLQGSEDVINIWKNTSSEIWKALYDYTTQELSTEKSFEESQYPLMTQDGLLSFSLNYPGTKDIYCKYKEFLSNISSHFKGGSVAINTHTYLQQQQEQKEELKQGLFDSLRVGKKEIILDSKYLYMDNGHHFYKNIIYKGKYKDYIQHELDLIDFAGIILKDYIYGKYIGLGVGDGAKDFHLLQYQQSHTSCLFIDSSLTSLQEAEILCRQGSHRMMFGQTHIDEVVFSQDWISDLAQGKDLGVVLGTFAQTSPPIDWNLPTLQDNHNFYAMLGGTYGNFSADYKIQFLQDMNTVMNTGDHILLSVFDKPTTEDEKKDIINHYNTKENFEFISNFFQKLGIDKENIQVIVDYKDDMITIDAMVIPYGKDIQMKGYGESIQITEPVKFEIFRSERFGCHTMSNYLDVSGTDLKIDHIIQKPGNTYKFYILKK